MIKVALTGGIGSGKSEVAAPAGRARRRGRRRRRAGPRGGRARDTRARRLWSRSSARRCWPPTGRLDRSALAAVVFADPRPGTGWRRSCTRWSRAPAPARAGGGRADGRGGRLQRPAAGRERAGAPASTWSWSCDAPDEVRLDRLVRLRGMREAEPAPGWLPRPTGAQRLAVGRRRRRQRRHAGPSWPPRSTRCGPSSEHGARRTRADVVTSVMSSATATTARITTASPAGTSQRALP